MNSKTDDQRQAVVGQPTAAHDISGRVLTRQQMTALLLMERRNTILRAQIIANSVIAEQAGTGAALGAKLVFAKLGALYRTASADADRAQALAEGRS